MDIPVILVALRNRHVRILGKAAMGKIPVFGFFYRRAVVMVDRSNAVARKKSMDRMKAIIRKNISIVVAPEGTFNETGKPLKEFYNGAFKLALEMQVPIQPIVLLDCFSRLNPQSIFSVNPGRSRAIFLPQINIVSHNTNDVEALKQTAYKAMEAELIRNKAAWIR